MEALFQSKQRTFGAVGFVNQANNSDEHKRRAMTKFQNDLDEALKQVPAPEVFVFFTNVNLTIGEKDDLIVLAKGKGLAHAEIFDRERIRIVLDSADGLSLRYQYLGMPLSEAEQASFFSRWGDDIQGLINTRFGAVETLLKRIHFFQEASLPLTRLWVSLQLDREYSGSEIGHFRAFVYLRYTTPVQRVLEILFGSADNAARGHAKNEKDLLGTRFGLSQGISGAEWEQRLPEEIPSNAESSPMSAEEYLERYVNVGSSSSVGSERAKFIGLSYTKDSFLRLDPGPRLIDFNEAHYAIFLNRTLAEKIETIRLFANDYKVAEIAKDAFFVSEASPIFTVPMVFTADELIDQWMTIRPRGASLFRFDFSEQTPRRFYSAGEMSGDKF